MAPSPASHFVTPTSQPTFPVCNPPTHSVAYAYACPMTPFTTVASGQGVAASSSPAGSASQFFAPPPRASPPSPSPATSFSQYTAPVSGLPSHPQGDVAWLQQPHAVPAPGLPSQPQGDVAWSQQPHAVPAPAGVSALHLLAVCDRVQQRRAVGHTAPPHPTPPSTSVHACSPQPHLANPARGSGLGLPGSASAGHSSSSVLAQRASPAPSRLSSVANSPTPSSLRLDTQSGTR
jgi:hypothetical protein